MKNQLSSYNHKKIIHIDMDCFYAAVEMHEHPQYKERPLAVGGTLGRGVLTTCNYPARKFGIRSAMPVHKAKELCPHLIILPVNMEKYRSVSKEIHLIFKRYTSIIEPLSLDEAYLDVTDSTLFKGSATYIANDIRRAIFEELGLTASAGIAPLKFLAKIASDINKPNGFYTISPQEIDPFIKQLKLEKISGVGKVTLAKLHQCNLFTGEDIQKSNLHQLELLFGKMGSSLWNYAHGIDPRIINNNRIRHSVAVEKTLKENIESYDDCLKLLEPLYQNLLKRLDNLDLKKLGVEKSKTGYLGINTQGIKLKFSDYKNTTVERVSTELNFDLYKTLLEIAQQRQNNRKIRLVGLSIGFNHQNIKKMTEDEMPQTQLEFNF